MSGRGRKQPNRGGARRSQPTSTKGSGAGRAKSGPTPSRQAAGARGGTPARSEQTVPVPAVSSRRPPPPGGSRRPAPHSSRESRHARAAKRKRNQRIGVLIGALALATALIGSRLAFQEAPTSASAQNTAQNAPQATAAAATSSAGATATATSAAPTASAMTMTCPSGGGASPVFGHQITVAAPYQVTITYGDGDKYTNDDAHLGAIFSHTYKKSGTYAVSAVLTADSGQTATAGCSYTWGP